MSDAPALRASDADRFAGIDVWRVPIAWARRSWGEVIRGIRKGEHRELHA